MRLQNEEAAYATCVADGLIMDATKDGGKVRALLDKSKAATDSADALAKTLGKSDERWADVFASYCEAIRSASEAILLLDGVACSDERCLYAALCIRHPELELDWQFLEGNRLKCQGKPTHGDWKAVELQYRLYFGAIRKAALLKLAE